MEPIAPVAKIFAWGPGATSLAAIALGFGFGFFLEKAGFGNAKTLAGQWYGYNFAVLRVMFTAIVVAMLGLFGLSAAGVVNLDLVYINDTFIWGQLVGGVIFGFGFVIGQYCPGTAICSAATGKLDGVLFLGGFFAGVLAFTYGFGPLEKLYQAGSKGRVLLPQFLHIPTGVVVFAVVLMAVGAFVFTHWLDKKLGNNKV
jgi:uncharacterized protein